jgi:hypothetical protein
VQKKRNGLIAEKLASDFDWQKIGVGRYSSEK